MLSYHINFGFAYLKMWLNRECLWHDWCGKLQSWARLQ